MTNSRIKDEDEQQQHNEGMQQRKRRQAFRSIQVTATLLIFHLLLKSDQSW